MHTKTSRPIHAALRPLAIAGLATAVALVGLAACSPRSVAPAADTNTPQVVTLTAAQRQHIRLYTVSRSQYRKTIEASGVVDFDNDQATSVIAPFSGPVSKLLVAAGDHVKKGAPLAVVDSSDFAAAASAYSKALATAETDRRVADMDKDLAQHNGISQREAAQAQTDAANAEADRAAALQTLVSLNVDARTIRDIQQHRSVTSVPADLRSPIAGTVVERLITPGQLLQAGTTAAFTVADLSRVWVMAQISGSDLASVHTGDPAEVETGSGSGSLSGTVDNISAEVNPDTRAVTARVVVDNPRGVLKKQMYVRVRIEGRRPTTGLLVPVSAVLRDDENLPVVYLAGADGGFARRRVTLGDRSGDMYDVTAGLSPGDRVVTEGGVFVQFMQSQ